MPVQIVVVDDGSADSTQDAVRRHVAQSKHAASYLLVAHSSRAGASEAHALHPSCAL